MSESTEVPAPPPPPLPPPKPEKIYLSNNAATSESIIHFDGCVWALSWPELQKACYLARVCLNSPPKECQFRIMDYQLQDGPTCGLTALSMLLSGDPSVDELLSTARELRFTNNGEMFSTEQLYHLVHKYFKNKQDDKANIQLYKGLLDCDQIRQHLMENACIFVPYDNDVNHTPCLKRGHKAHWALIVGFLITNEDEFFVLARHGKTKNLAVWSLKSLSDSNANLFEFVSPKCYVDLDFLFPPGGIAGDLGLNEQAIVVNAIKHEIFDIKNNRL